MRYFKVLAHEIGHNLGMYHDFDKKHAGENCNFKGIMSYGGTHYTQWSKCSRKDFEQHYESQKWGNSCLEDISGISK